MMKKRMTAALAVLTAVMMSTVCFAGAWSGSYDTGWKYQRDDGTFVANAWFQDTDGAWYYFGGDGIMMHNAWIEGKYYLGTNGAMLVNAVTPDGYLVGADGAWIPNGDGQAEGAGQTSQAADTSAATGASDAAVDAIVNELNILYGNNEDAMTHGSARNAGNGWVEVTDTYTYPNLSSAFLLEHTKEIRDDMKNLAKVASEKYGETIRIRFIQKRFDEVISVEEY